MTPQDQRQDQITLTINGTPVCVKAVSPTQTLLEFLRQRGGVGTKEGCGDGDCGACTVAIAARNHQGRPQYHAVNSCLIPLAAVAGRDIVTVEGLGGNHPVQVAMVETGGSQCGYCTPGFIMSLFAAYYQGRLTDACVEGNLCRCTGYLAIRRAAQQVASLPSAADEFRDRLQATSTNPASPILSAFSYYGNDQSFHRPTQLQDLLNLMQQYPQATLIAGGTDLGLEISYHRQQFGEMISLEAVTELRTLENRAESVEIGAAVPLSHLEEQLQGVFPSLDEMLYWFAARQVRNRATLGGNIGTASPIGDLPPVLLSLDATLKLVSLGGERTLPLHRFFKGYRQTDLQSGEVIVSVNIPKTDGLMRRVSQSYKVGKRGTDDISIVSAAFVIDRDGQNFITHARLAYGGVAATPVRAIAVEEFLIGKPWNFETVRQAKPMLYDAFTPLTDLRGSADYRRLLVANLFEKFFVEFGQTEEAA